MKYQVSLTCSPLLIRVATVGDSKVNYWMLFSAATVTPGFGRRGLGGFEPIKQFMPVHRYIKRLNGK